ARNRRCAVARSRYNRNARASAPALSCGERSAAAGGWAGRACRHRCPSRRRAEFGHAIYAIVALLGGEKRDLTDVEIDDSGLPDFNKRVYTIVRKIPPGATMTYGEIAERLPPRPTTPRRRGV